MTAGAIGPCACTSPTCDSSILLMNIYLHAHWLLFHNLMHDLMNMQRSQKPCGSHLFPLKKRYSYAPREFRHVSVWVFTKETQSNYLTVVR